MLVIVLVFVLDHLRLLKYVCFIKKPYTNKLSMARQYTFYPAYKNDVLMLTGFDAKCCCSFAHENAYIMTFTDFKMKTNHHRFVFIKNKFSLEMIFQMKM